MPMIVMCGMPCTGKSAMADRLSSYMKERGKTVVIVRDEGDRNLLFADSAAEKQTRALRKAAVERVLSRDDVVIIDALNYIKGFRYELFCCVRQAKTTNCVVFCDCRVDTAREWNRARPDGARYSDDLFDALVQRFEEPRDGARWDSPLFWTQADDDEATRIDAAAVFAALFERASLSTHIAVHTQPLAEADALHQWDAITQDVAATLLRNQSGAVAGQRLSAGPQTDSTLLYSRPISAAEMRRLRKQFMSVARTQNSLKGTASAAQSNIATSFVLYLNTQCQP